MSQISDPFLFKIFFILLSTIYVDKVSTYVFTMVIQTIILAVVGINIIVNLIIFLAGNDCNQYEHISNQLFIEN